MTLEKLNVMEEMDAQSKKSRKFANALSEWDAYKAYVKRLDIPESEKKKLLEAKAEKLDL